MKVMIVGSGGREHALLKCVKRSPLAPEVFVAPGNPGMDGEAGLVSIGPASVEELAVYAEEQGIDLTIVGPEAPLLAGIADRFAERDLRIVAPSASAAAIEGSKVFAKEFMKRHGIPTAPFAVAETPEEALAEIRRRGVPSVIKADGLAGGKGVVVATTSEMAEEAIRTIMVDRRFGAAGERVVIEETLEGPEASLFVLTDGTSFLPIGTAEDHKRLLDGDEGPNTGGMGAFAPAVRLPESILQEVLARIVAPCVASLKEEGMEYRGFLYCGLMLTKDGPSVLEWNARMGDPETQAVLPLLQTDLLPALASVADGKLQEMSFERQEKAAATVVLASQGYPVHPTKGHPINGLSQAAALPDVEVTTAGVALDEAGRLVTGGGRVVGVTGLGSNLGEAVLLANRACDLISFEGKFHRHDIGAKGLAHLARQP